MGELANCPKCNAIFVKTPLKMICQDCFKQEEMDFEKVYKFLRKRENRTALIDDVVEATDVDEDLILKFIRSGRIQLSNFPNLGYPCAKCGTNIREGKLCSHCESDIKSQVKQMEREESHKRDLELQQNKKTFYAYMPKNK
ncbi:TIGR03826 family flagellar region protein [Metabacillus fastidiosus]|uniref:TIGR03826 family flagellar region protein n=1 Tax=Metabacillus fastidiosus TaxID=1458 RepID=UPI002E1FBE4A|nr:TIGR03826 family flagellar region protein [Metabacillus fastidiosus]MED4534098.1 hypothetical protein [Metabacillus fastidiosus]